MKVALIIGVCPPGLCGVGDYTACLDKALRIRGVESHVIASEDWNVSSVLRVRRNLREHNFDIVHIEYPTVGFGARLGPQALSLLRGCVVTIHEASQRHFLRKLALFPFSVRPEHIIFTSSFERQFATKWAPWISSVSSVIPVGSNIGVGARKGPRNLSEVVYFGLIMPGKGVEKVVELSRLIKSAGLRSGLLPVAIGTHALIEKDVEFAKLGLVIIDEQHRFGVMQRLQLVQKGVTPDVLVMTATPIPRTLAMTVYGDLDVSVIDEMPPGRKKIFTKHYTSDQVELAYSAIRREIDSGRQAYVVYPVIEESETQAMKAAQQMYEMLAREVFPDLPIGLLHGRLASAEKEAAMERFKTGSTKILVSTTVIEVGVDVPNATVMVVEQAERFGLVATASAERARGARRGTELLSADHGEDERRREGEDSDAGGFAGRICDCGDGPEAARAGGVFRTG